MRRKVDGIKLWRLSTSVRAIVDEYLLHEKNRKAESTNAAFAYLKNGQARSAAETIVAYERTRLFPRGMGIDWDSPHWIDVLTNNAEIILEATPRILKGWPENDLALLRPIAALLELTGESNSKLLLPSELTHNLRLEKETAIQMLRSYANKQRRLEQLRETSFKRARVVACEDSCETCRLVSKQVYGIDQLPELPHPDCTHSMGCRCSYQAVIPSMNNDI